MVRPVLNVPARVAVVAATLAAAALVAACSGAEPGAADAVTVCGAPDFERHTHENQAGTRNYKLYVPSSYCGDRLPLVVQLHGCGSDGDEEARWSRFNTLAEARGFLVAYPEQDAAANGSRCWNWFDPQHQERGSGEPAIIAGITGEVASTYAVDRRRIYVGGISAGGAMSVIMAVTYPDIYAAAMTYAGCQYRGTTCAGSVSVVPPETAGQWAYEAAAPWARVIPVIVIQGDADALVPFPNADLVVQQFLALADWADDGVNNGSIPRERAATGSGAKPDGHGWDIDYYTDADGCGLAERWLVRGLGHAWSNGESQGSLRDELFTDSRGPDVTTRIYDFFLEHPMPSTGTACHQGISNA